MSSRKLHRNMPNVHARVSARRYENAKAVVNSNLPPFVKKLPLRSASNYLRTIETTHNGQVASSSRRSLSANALNPTPQAYGRMVAYGAKNVDDLQEEIMILKRNMMNMAQENTDLKGKLKRLQDEVMKKERELDSLGRNMDIPSTSAQGINSKRTSDILSTNLKQKILRLEQNLKNKDTSLNALKMDLKTTRVQEMRTHTQTFYQEIIRLQHRINELQGGVHESNLPAELSLRLKTLNNTISQLNEHNAKLVEENNRLKSHVGKDTSNRISSDDDNSDREHWSKKKLLQTVQRLETDFGRKDQEENRLLEKKTAKADALKSENARLKASLERAKEEQDRLRQKLDRQADETLKLQKRVKTAEKEAKDRKNSYAESNRQRSPPSYDEIPRTSIPNGGIAFDKKDGKIAARPEVEKFRQKHAAKTIQHHWRSYNTERDDAASTIAAMARGHLSRTQYHNDRASEVSSTY